MLYTIAEAAKATGLEESIIFRAIEDGQIHGTRNVSGEWRVEDAELHSLYLSIAQHYCKRQWQTDLQRGDGRGQEPEIANIADNEEGRGGQQHTHTAAAQAENSVSTPATASISQDGLRIDNRDRISASDTRPAFRLTRTRFITGAVLLVFSCIGVLTSFYFVGRSQLLEKKAISSSLVLGSEKASIPIATLATGSRQENIGNLASATADAIDHPHESPKNLSQAPSSPPAATEQNTTASHTAAKTGQAKAVRKLVPVPETKPTTIKGWTVRNVVNGIATLDGPEGTLKAARGDTLPGLGKVDSVVLWGNRWIVSTSKGLITTP